MERTESIVIQVAPSYENTRIKEMEMFGWNLQGRQEIHEQGEAYGRPSFLSDSTYVVKTKVSQYVKLHFVRALDTPNLAQIKQIEDQYFTLPFPELPAPKSFLWPLFFILCAIVSISNPKTGDAIGSFIACGAIGILWLYFKIKKRQNSLATCMESIKRQEELLNQLQSLG
jgi:hypothetical protein